MATKANLVIDQGATYSTDLTLLDENGDPITLEGYTVNSQIRKWYTSSTVSANFVTNVKEDTGVVTLSLSAEQTANLAAGRYVYDVELSSGPTISRIVEGIVTVTPNVTR